MRISMNGTNAQAGIQAGKINKPMEMDSFSKSIQNQISNAQKQLQDALSFEGSDEEKNVRMYLNSLGIDYDSLTKEELVTQINILKKSKHLKSPYSQRGKTKKKRK